MKPPRKLAEIWDVNGNYHLRVEVTAFQRQFTGDPARAEDFALYEAIEVIRTILAMHDADQLELRSDDTLTPAGP